MKKKIFLIDGPSLLYRAFYGLAPLRTSTGTPTQAVYGFFRSLNKLISDYSPTNILVAWDHKESDRKKIFADYKATRNKAPDDLIVQMGYVKNILSKMEILQLDHGGCEADDIVGTAAKECGSVADVFVVSSDKDLLQLVGGSIRVIDPFKGVLMDTDKVHEKFGFGPNKVQFYHSLLGDSSDNIPGVRGIGKKTATDLVTSFDSLDDLYKNLEKVEKPRTKKLLEEGYDNAMLSFKLFALRECKVVCDLERSLYKPEAKEFAYDLFQELELKTFLPANKKNKKKVAEQASEKICHYDYKIIKTQDCLEDLSLTLKQSEIIACDLETSGLDWSRDKVVGVSLSADGKEGFYIPVGHKNLESEELEKGQLEKNIVIKFLEELFSIKGLKFIFHNGKFDLHFLRYCFGLEVPGFFFDTAIAARLLFPEWVKVGLKSLSQSVLGVSRPDCKDVMKGLKTFEFVDIQKAAGYAVDDACQTFLLYEKLNKKFAEEEKLKKLFFEVEMPVSKVLLNMESVGISLDEACIKKLGSVVGRELAQVESKLEGCLAFIDGFDAASINFNSPSQVASLLFDTLNLKGEKLSGKGFRSTDTKVLEGLSHQHPVPALILQHRKLAKLRGTYSDSLLACVSKSTKKVHTDFSQIMVSTGRLSSFGPNLQNIPEYGVSGINVRRCFVASPGKTFLSFDYSQIELRILAYLCQDSVLLNAFEKDIDIHKKTASEIFDSDLNRLTKEQRDVGKKINFSILYGLSPFGLSKALNIKRTVAEQYIDSFFATYPAVRPWMNDVIQKAEDSGYVETILGRKRWFEGLKDSNKLIVRSCQRAAINAVVQGSAADVIKMAMVQVGLKFSGVSNVNLLLQVHDELLFEVKKGSEVVLAETIKQLMESVVDWKPNIPVNVKIGDSWGGMK